MLKDRKTRRDFKPRFRVIVLIDEYDRRYLKLEECVNVTTTTSINSINNATVTLSNLADKWFNKARSVPKTYQRQKEIVDYLEEVLAISELRERNFERTKEFYNLIKKGKIKGGVRNRNIEFFDEQDNGKLIKTGDVPENYSDAYKNYEYLPLDFELMKRVWIDFADRNDEWAPAFSGYISGVKTNYNTAQPSTLTLECKGILGLLQKSEVVVQEAVDPRFEPFRKGAQVSAGFSSLTNNLSGLSGEEIISTVLKLIRDFYCYNAGDTSNKEQSNYYYQEPLWLMDGDRYSGQTLANNIGYGAQSIAYKPIRFWEKGISLHNMLGKFIIDPEIVESENKRYEVFQKAIRTGFQLYQNKTEYAYNICKRVADLVGYEFFEDPKGNIIFQAPKYDKLPRLSGEISSDETRFTDNYSNIPYHSRDYILDHISLRNRRYGKSEDGLVTFVTTNAEPNLITVSDETIDAEQLHGYTTYDRISEISKELADKLLALNRRFGTRRHEMQPMITGTLGGNTDLLDRWALQSLNKINAAIHAGTIGAHQRPDLWPGKTVFLVEEQKLAYIVGTTNSINFEAKSPHDTQLSLEYVHHPSDIIGDPWKIATESVEDTNVVDMKLFQT